MAEEMAKGLGQKAVLTTGVPASFNPGYWDLCWQKDCSWSTPWCVPTLRVLSKLRAGDQIGSLDLFAEPWTVPYPLLSLKDMPLSTLKAGYMPDNLTAGTELHFLWIALPSSLAMDWATADHLQLDATWPLGQSNYSWSPLSALCKVLHWKWQGVACYQTDEQLALLLVPLSKTGKDSLRVFNRRYCDWLCTVQDEVHIDEPLRCMSTVLQLDGCQVEKMAMTLAKTLEAGQLHAGLERGLLGHCPCAFLTIRKLETDVSTWSDQFADTGDDEELVFTEKKTKRNVTDWDEVTIGHGDCEIVVRRRTA